MQYLQPFLYFVKKPQTGFTNLLIGCLAPLIPIAGEMVLLGYRAEVSEELERDPDLKDHPDFSLDKLAAYLQRGVWPYLSRLISYLVLLSLGAIVSVLVGFGLYQVVPEPLLCLGFGGLTYFVCFILSNTLVWPMEYHAQIRRKFAPLDDFQFAIRFARVCWLSTLVAVLMHTMFSFVALFLGMLLLWIGIYPAIVIVQMAEQHLMTQLYLHYLDEGGEPIPRPEIIAEPRRDDDDFEDDDERPKRAHRVD